MFVLLLIALLGLKVYGVDVPAQTFSFAFLALFCYEFGKLLAEWLHEMLDK